MRHIICVSVLAMVLSHWISSARVFLEDAEDAAWFDVKTAEAKEALRLSQERK